MLKIIISPKLDYCIPIGERGRSGGGGGGSLVKECRLSDGGRYGGGYDFSSITGRGS